MCVIPLGFDLEKFQIDYENQRLIFREEFKINDDDICIGIVGRLTSIKNHDFFIRAIKDVLAKTDRSLKVFIIGDGEEKSNLMNLSDNLNLAYNANSENEDNALIYFTSWRSDMPSVYAGLDIVALTSLNEGTPVTLIEAQASNKPIVSTDVGGVRDILEEGVTGLLSPSKDLDSFVNNLILLIENRDLRNSMGASGYSNVFKKFGYIRLVNDVKSLYGKLINEK